MADYLTLPTTVNSVMNLADGKEVERATNGKLKVRRLFASDKAVFDLEHELTAAQKTSLDGHYTTDKDAAFSYTWPAGGTFTVQYTAPPQYAPQPGGWFIARVQLAEV